MELKRNAADRITGILSGLKLTRISDKIVRNTLLNDYLALRKVAKELAEEQNELVNRFNEDWKADKDEKKAEYEAAVAEIQKELNGMADRLVDITVFPLDMDVFLANVKGEELSFEHVAILEENGLLKR